MVNKIKVDLIFIEEVKNEDDIEHLVNVKADLGEVFKSKFYEYMNKDIRLEHTLKIRSYLLNYIDNGQLRYVDFQGKRYIIESVDSLKGRYSLLNLSEMM